MPTYDFKCAQCDKIFQVIKSITDNSTEKCAHCGEILKKQFGIGAVTFKGNGWGRD